MSSESTGATRGAKLVKCNKNHFKVDPDKFYQYLRRSLKPNEICKATTKLLLLILSVSYTFIVSYDIPTYTEGKTIGKGNNVQYCLMYRFGVTSHTF